MPPPNPDSVRHKWYEDVLGIFSGVLMCAVSLHILSALGFITGQMAGLALLLSHLTAYSFGVLFFVLNVPFYIFGLRQMGWVFTAKSLAAVATLSAMTEILPLTLTLGPVDPAVGITIFGILTSVGLIAVFRHGASIGGITILGLVLQDKGIAKAGHVQMAFDICLFALAVWVFPWSLVAWSLAGAVILNVMIVLNHRRDRYIA